MGSPPSPDNTALEAPPFTPSHPLVGQLLSFTEFLLNNIEDWSKPHPFCPPPPAPLSFSGSERFIRGRLPHRTVAISASLSAVFDGGTCNHGDVGDADADADADDAQNVTCVAGDVASAQELQVKDRSPAPANAQVETPGISAENRSVQNVFSDGADNVFQHDRLVDHNDSAHSSHADSQMTLDVSDKSSDVKLIADEQRIGGHEVLAEKTGVSSQIDNLDQSSLEMPVTGEDFQGMGGISNPPLIEQADDVEEGEISETFSAGKQLVCMSKDSDQGGANAKDGSPDSTKHAADAQRGRAYDASSPDKLCTNAETDEEMDEPISLFVSRCRGHLLRKQEEQKQSSQDVNLKHLTKRTHDDIKKEQLSRIATATDAKDDRGFSCSQIDSIPASALSISDPTRNMNVFGVMGASDKRLEQLFNEGGNQPEAGKPCKAVENAKSLFDLVSFHLMVPFSLCSSCMRALFDVGVTCSVGCHVRSQKLW